MWGCISWHRGLGFSVDRGSWGVMLGHRDLRAPSVAVPQASRRDRTTLDFKYHPVAPYLMHPVPSIGSPFPRAQKRKFPSLQQFLAWGTPRRPSPTSAVLDISCQRESKSPSPRRHPAPCAGTRSRGAPPRPGRPQQATRSSLKQPGVGPCMAADHTHWPAQAPQLRLQSRAPGASGATWASTRTQIHPDGRPLPHDGHTHSHQAPVTRNRL